MWRWTPGFYAGAVRAELIDKENGRSLGTWWLDVSPDPGKAGSEIFDAMVEAILDFDEALLVGDEPARRRLGALGDDDDPHILFERLRRREDDLDRAIAMIQREPASVLRPRRGLVSFRAVRRTDVRTLRAALRHAESRVALRHGHDASSAFVHSVAAEPRFDVPAVERRFDAPVNRCALYLLRALQRRCRRLRRRWSFQGERESATRTPLQSRLAHRLRILERIERKMRVAERRSPFHDAARPELSSAGLTAVAAHPLYARLWRVGWEALRHGASRHDPRDLLALSQTWEVYERWGVLSRWQVSWSCGCRKSSGRGTERAWPGPGTGETGATWRSSSTTKRLPVARMERTGPASGPFPGNAGRTWSCTGGGEAAPASRSWTRSGELAATRSSAAWPSPLTSIGTPCGGDLHRPRGLCFWFPASGASFGGWQRRRTFASTASAPWPCDLAFHRRAGSAASSWARWAEGRS